MQAASTTLVCSPLARTVPRLLCQARLALAYHQHIQSAWAMRSLDSIQLDIGGGRWTRDECDGLSPANCCIVQSCDSFWNKIHDLIFINNTQVVVWEQRNGASSLVGAVIQHDGPRLGNAERTTCQHSVAAIQLLVGQRIGIGQWFDVRRKPVLRQVRRNDEAVDVSCRAGRSNGLR